MREVSLPSGKRGSLGNGIGLLPRILHYTEVDIFVASLDSSFEPTSLFCVHIVVLPIPVVLVLLAQEAKLGQNDGFVGLWTGQ